MFLTKNREGIQTETKTNYLTRILDKGVSDAFSWESGTLDCKEIKPVNPKGNQFWIFIGRTDAEAIAPILWPPDVKNWFIGKDPDTGKDWRQDEKGTTEDEMLGWHHQLNGREFEWTLRVGDGQGSLTCCNPWGRKESDMTDWTDAFSDTKRARSLLKLIKENRTT